MKTKLWLTFVLCTFAGWLQAQDTIKSLIISEARFDIAYNAYVELTNMGDSSLHLNTFEFGVVHSWDSRIDTTDPDKWFHVGEDCWFILPDTTLNPGESIVFTRNRMTSFGKTGEVWQGSDCWYVRYHHASWSDDTVPVFIKDSIVTDQVGGVFTGPDGQQACGGKDVAGMAGATGNSILVRKFSIKKGNTDFEKGRGTNAYNSEWILIPVQSCDSIEANKNRFWTVGNHVNANLEPETLVSATLSINRTDSVIDVPWGKRRDNPVMQEFTMKPGIAWHYDYSASYEDSAYMSVRTGDILTLYACGDTVEIIPFRLMVSDPEADANIVIPKRTVDPHHSFAGERELYEVTEGVPGMDTIRSNLLYENSSASHVDTLLKYLEKAPNAQWEILFVDENSRIHVKNGDVLRVISENGQSKEYYIKVSGPHTESEAFVTSDVYNVNQVEFIISGDFLSNGGILVSDFLSNLIPSPGALVRVLDHHGREKTGIVLSGDYVKVTSADGTMEHVYIIEIFVSVINTEDFNTISIFPNPASGEFSISGIPVQSKIVITNVQGRKIFETYANHDCTQFSLEKQPAGLYFILISNDNVSACFKMIRLHSP